MGGISLTGVVLVMVSLGQKFKGGRLSQTVLVTTNLILVSQLRGLKVSSSTVGKLARVASPNA